MSDCIKLYSTMSDRIFLGNIILNNFEQTFIQFCTILYGFTKLDSSISDWIQLSHSNFFNCNNLYTFLSDCT